MWTVHHGDSLDALPPDWLTSLQHPLGWHGWHHPVGKPLEQDLVEDVKVTVASVH